MTEKKEPLSALNYTYSDRALDEDPSPWDITLPSSRDTIDLLEYWPQMQNRKKAEQPESPEWKSLETSYLTHLRWRFDYPRKIATQQIAFTWIMTFLVFALVVAGLIFSFIQLNYALKVGNFSATSTTLEVEVAGKLSFQSSVIGAVVLIVSLVFYYLYLQFVFSAKPNKPLHLSLYNTDAPRLFGKRRYVPRRRRSDKKASEE